MTVSQGISLPISGASHSAFTPGPWELEAGFLVALQSNGLNMPLLLLFDPEGETGFLTGDQAECEANARLIAAAPDLLEALEPAALDVAANQLEADGLTRSAEVLRELARRQRAAIAKALATSPASPEAGS